jgi:hypothetical protein
MKTCAKCREQKPLDQFGKWSLRPDGKHIYCRDCTRQIGRESARASRLTQSGREASKARQTKANHKTRSTPSGRAKHCKAALEWAKKYPAKHAAAQMKRHADKLLRTPLWFEADKVAMVYAKAKEWGLAVDHVIPLRGKNVSGLHCWANLQLLHPSLNSSKGNKYEY